MKRDAVEGDVPDSIPSYVLRERGPLSPMQAISWYLTVDENGPGLTQAEAGELTGTNRKQIGQAVTRARDKYKRAVDDPANHLIDALENGGRDWLFWYPKAEQAETSLERVIEDSIQGEGDPIQPSQQIREAAAAWLKDTGFEDATDKVRGAGSLRQVARVLRNHLP